MPRLFTLGGYIGVLVTNATGSLMLAMVAAMIVVGLVGMAVYRLCLRAPAGASRPTSR